MTRPESRSSASESHTSEQRLGSAFMASMIRSAYAERIISAIKGSVQHLSWGVISFLLTGLVSWLLILYSPLSQTRGVVFIAPYLGFDLISTFPLLIALFLVGPLTQTSLDKFDRFEDVVESDKKKEDETSESDKTGVIYARVSSDKQVNEGYSLESQVGQMREKAMKFGVNLIRDPIKDEGQTGTDFRRKGIGEVFRLAENGEITHLFVNSISRIGRNAPQTVYFVYRLQEKCDVTIVLSNGSMDVTEFKDLMSLCLKALISQKSVQERSQASIRSRIRRFVEGHNWSTWYPTVPLGYNKTDEDWLEVDSEEVTVVKNLFERFQKTKSYAKTARYINNQTDLTGRTLSDTQVKRYLQKKVYIGKPTINMTTDLYEEDELTAEDQSLQIIERESHEHVQEIIASKEEKYSTDSQTKDIDDFVEMFGFFTVLECNPNLVLQCPECNVNMNKYGQRTLANKELVHNYRCPNCGRQKKFPNEKEQMKMLQNE